MLWPIFKKDLSLSKLYLLIAPLLLASLHLGDAGNLGVYIYLLLFASYYPFYADFHHKMNRFMVSLPLSKKKIVASRYLTLLVLVFITIGLHFLSDFLLALIFPRLEFTAVDPIMLVFTIFFISLLLSLILPVYYLAKSFIRGFSISFYLVIATMILGFGLVNSLDLARILNNLSLNPYLLLLTMSALSLYLSYLLSVYIFSKKDL